MRDLAKLSDMALSEIEALEADGVTLMPAEIVEINALGWAVESPECRRLLARGVPVEIGGVWLWPLTLYGQDWFDRVGCRMTGGWATYALAYAMARQYEDGEPLKADGRTAERDVRRWARGLRCRFGALNIAISDVLRQDEEHEEPPDPPGKESGGMTAGDFSAFLASVAGAAPDFWERRCAVGYTHAVLWAITRQNMADGKPSMSDPKIIATRALGWACEKIRQARKQAAVEQIAEES